jgi:hypothetical protein
MAIFLAPTDAACAPHTAMLSLLIVAILTQPTQVQEVKIKNGWGPSCSQVRLQARGVRRSHSLCGAVHCGQHHSVQSDALQLPWAGTNSQKYSLQ